MNFYIHSNFETTGLFPSKALIAFAAINSIDLLILVRKITDQIPGIGKNFDSARCPVSQSSIDQNPLPTDYFKQQGIMLVSLIVEYALKCLYWSSEQGSNGRRQFRI